MEVKSRGRNPVLGLVVLLGVALSCPGCSSSSSPRLLAAGFGGSGTTATPDQVRLRGGATSGDLVTVEVSITGPTTSSDLYAFAFDLVLSDDTVAEYVPSSATIGSALSVGPGQSTLILAAQNGSRVVVGVTKTGGGAGTGNGVGNTEEVVVSLVFRVLRQGTTTISFAGSPNHPQNPTADPAALDSTGTVIASISFDTAAASIFAN